jgi:hypothetical protein
MRSFAVWRDLQPFEDSDDRLDREIHGFDEREDLRHHSETDEHHGSSVYRKPAVRLDEDDEKEAA